MTAASDVPDVGRLRAPDIARVWAQLLPLLQGGGILCMHEHTGRYHVDGWGELTGANVVALEHKGVIRELGPGRYVLADRPVVTPPLSAELYPAITVWQPWAALVAEGVKPFEFRGWKAPAKFVGRRVAIHAGARRVRVREVKTLLLRLQRGEGLDTGLHRGPAVDVLERVMVAPGSLPLGAVVCTALLGEPIRGAALAAELGLPAINDSDREEHSNWGWPLSQVQRLEPPEPARGKQGWWLWQAPR